MKKRDKGRAGLDSVSCNLFFTGWPILPERKCTVSPRIQARFSTWRRTSSEKRLLLSLVLNKTGSGLSVSSVEAPVCGPGATRRTLANNCTTSELAPDGWEKLTVNSMLMRERTYIIQDFVKSKVNRTGNRKRQLTLARGQESDLALMVKC